jgi:hypothetical protein
VGIISFGEDEAGELYASTSSGRIYHVVTTNNFVRSQPVAQDASETVTSFVFPALVENSTITIVLNDAYKFVHVLDMNGNEVVRQNITGVTGKTSLHLPPVAAGTYIVRLVGNKSLQQKIYVTK